MIVYETSFQFWVMNQTIQKNQDTLVRSKSGSTSAKTLLTPLANQRAFKETKLLAFGPSITQRRRSINYLFSIVAFFSLTIFGLQTKDVIHAEACKALLIILLLVQLKNLTQPVKQN